MLARLKVLQDRPTLVGLLLALAAQILFLVHIDQPSITQFDETHYVPAARVLLALEGPRNVEHPMVAKELVATGIALLGDNPFGWRVVPSIFGSLTVAAVFALLWLLLGSMRFAVLGGALAMLNQTLFIQARIAMLDVFLGAFVLWAMVLMLAATRASPRRAWGYWLAAAVLWGLAVGTKWAAVPYLAMAGATFLFLRLRDARLAKRPLAWALAGADQPHWRGLATIPALLVLGLVSVAVYFLTFLPAFFYAQAPLTLERLLPFQQEMYALQTQILASHTYQSDWWTWPLMIRPIWYFYEYDAGAQRGVLLIGNPVIMWGGLVAVLACYWAWFRSRAWAALAVALLWTASVGIYAVIPKSLGFYYYYHLSGIFICLAIAVAFHHHDRGRKLGREEWFAFAALLVFGYFYPILSAAPLDRSDAFNDWMWFNSWR